jgi:hypothetical protein
MNNIARVCGILLDCSKRITVSTRDIEYAIKCIYPLNYADCISYVKNMTDAHMLQTNAKEKHGISHTKQNFVALMVIHIPRVRVTKSVDVLVHYYIQFLEQNNMCEEINKDILLLHVACEVMNFRHNTSLQTKDIYIAMHIIMPELDVEPYNDELIDNIDTINIINDDKTIVMSVIKKYRDTSQVNSNVVMCWKFMVSKIPVATIQVINPNCCKNFPS